LLVSACYLDDEQRQTVNLAATLHDTFFASVSLGRRIVSAARNRWLFDYDFIHSGFSLWPRKIVLEVTHRCNLRCFMCSLYGTKDSGSVRADQYEREAVMTLQERRALVNQVAGFRPLIAFSGGEPLLYRECFALAEYIKSKGLPCIIITNGTMLSRHAEAAVASGVDAIAVSLDGPEAVHDEIRGVPGTFAKACRGIRDVQRVRRERGTRSLEMKVTYCITNKNYDRLREFLDIAEDLQVDQVTFSHLWFTTPQAAGEHNRDFPDCGKAFPENLIATPGIDVDVLADQIESVRAKQTPFPVVFMPDLASSEVQTYYGDPAQLVKTDRCRYPWLVVRVLPNGDTIPCLGVIIGNAKRDSFASCWNGKTMRQFRRRLQGAGTFPVCARCCGLFEHGAS